VLLGHRSSSVSRIRIFDLRTLPQKLPRDILAAMEDKDSFYNVGWSCGKEILADGRPDTLKVCQSYLGGLNC
jgi:hypothetical protein